MVDAQLPSKNADIDSTRCKRGLEVATGFLSFGGIPAYQTSRPDAGVKTQIQMQLPRLVHNNYPV